MKEKEKRNNEDHGPIMNRWLSLKKVLDLHLVYTYQSFVLARWFKILVMRFASMERLTSSLHFLHHLFFMEVGHFWKDWCRSERKHLHENFDCTRYIGLPILRSAVVLVLEQIFFGMALNSSLAIRALDREWNLWWSLNVLHGLQKWCLHRSKGY